MNYRPVYNPAPRAVARPQLGSLSSLSGVDWVMLFGGAIVGGAGINGLVSQFSGPAKPNAIGVGLDLILTGVGLTLFFQNGAKAIA